ncbi:MAG: L-aspartate oxidase [Planctomycetota bacterium]|nr:MAG: L-aspartate oxidase [Planctomycetota bacterium]
MSVDLRIAVPRRYLVRMRPKRQSHVFTDVLIIGGGIAGIRAALEIDPRLDVLVVTKDTLDVSNSAYAQGGIAGVLDPSDDVADHERDTLAAGCGLCDPQIVRMVVREAPERIRELSALGAQFDRENGRLALTQEGGHSHRRIVHALGDATGKEVMRALVQRVRDAEHIRTWERAFTVDLLTHEGSCRGAFVHTSAAGGTMVWAKRTILATGGAGRLYRETTNPPIATADGHAMGFRAGAVVRDMEFMQFHPTVLYIAGGARYLISEAVRGEGAVLRNVRGERFMPQYSPDAELAPRDVVARAITDQMALTTHPCVYLDLSHLDPDLIRRRFPHIGRVCAEFGIDITRDWIPVRPGAHYMIGGLQVDAEGRTSLPGLFAAGEVTSSGLHGANRLASNSLLEGLVFGAHAGAAASREALEEPDRLQVEPIDWEFHDGDDDEELDVADLEASLRSLMWRDVGIRRNADHLSEAARQVDFWQRYAGRREFASPRGWELQNMLLVSRAMIAAASLREESRGVHFRTDFPDPRPEFARHITLAAAGEDR